MWLVKNVSLISNPKVQFRYVNFFINIFRVNITYYLTDLKISKVDSVFFIEENYSTHALNDNFLKCFAVREPVNLWMLQKTCMYSLPMPLNIVSIPLYFKNSPLLIQNWGGNLKQSLHCCPVSSFTSHILLQVDWGLQLEHWHLVTVCSFYLLQPFAVTTCL